MSRSIFIRKASFYKKDINYNHNLYSMAIMPNEGQVREKMEAICKRELNKSLAQMTLEELEDAKSKSDSLVDKELSGFEQTMLGGAGIAEGKRLAKKILDEEIEKRKAQAPKPATVQQPILTPPNNPYYQQPAVVTNQPQVYTPPVQQTSPAQSEQNEMNTQNITKAIEDFLKERGVDINQIEDSEFENFISELMNNFSD